MNVPLRHRGGSRDLRRHRKHHSWTNQAVTVAAAGSLSWVFVHEAVDEHKLRLASDIPRRVHPKLRLEVEMAV
jgi:hypothetical protein